MQRDESHSLPNAGNYAFDDSRIDISMRRMSPPDQDIGRLQSLLGKTVLRFL